MVVCNMGPLIPTAQAACPITPSAAPYPFTQTLCSINPISVPYNQRYPPPTILTLTTTASPVSTPQTSPNSDSSISENSSISCSVVPSNGNSVITYTPVPTNLVPITNRSNIVPYTTTVVQCKVPNQTTTASNLVSCNQGIFTTFPPNSIMPLQPKIVCPITPTLYSNGTVDIRSISSSPPAIFPVPPQNICTATPASSWKQSYGMEQVWQCEFRTLFLQYAPHAWMLLPVNTKPTGIWHANVDSAKVRFCCEDCGHGWTSMKGRVAFWFILNPATNEGVVCLKLYGQQCDRCKTGNYEPAMWYPEEVIKVLVNIYNRVGQVYYGFQQAPYHKARRPGKPRTPHNSDLCQACKDGVCSERR